MPDKISALPAAPLGTLADTDLFPIVSGGQTKGASIATLRDKITPFAASFCPLDYGAIGDGVTNDGPAIRACLVAARTWACATLESTNFKLPVVDLRGRAYATNVQIEIPGGQGMTIQNGSIVAGAGFTSGLYLVRLGDSADTAMTDGYRNVNTTFRNVYFDNKRVGGGLMLERCARIVVDRCIFAHYTTAGLKTTSTSSREIIITNCQFAEYLRNETDGVTWARPDLAVGTAIDIDSTDLSVSHCTIGVSKVGIKVNKGNNRFDNIHIATGYVKNAATVAGPTALLDYLSTGLWLTAGANTSTFDQMYFESCEVLWETPWKTTLTNSTFYQGWGDATRAFIRFKPMAASTFINGVVIKNCLFNVINSGAMKMTSVDTTVGTFSTGQVKHCSVEDNFFAGNITPQYTRIKMALSQSAASTWAFDLTGMMVFGNTFQQVMFSVYHWGGGSQLFRLTNVTGMVFTIGSYAVATPTTLSTNNATVYLDVTINQSH